MLSELQKKAAQAIVNVFETGRAQGEYGKVTLLSGDSGHLTYGRSQTTLASGNLFLLVKSYCEAEGAELSSELEGFLPKLADNDLSLDRDMRLRRLLREAGGDPVMQAVQDGFFDRVYWQPAAQAAASINIESGLGVGVVYDSHVHGSWRRMRDRTTQRFGSVADIGAESWITRYIEVRRDWLANHSNTLLHKTVYRMDSLSHLIKDENWDLNLPFRVRGIVIDEFVLSGEGVPRAAEENEESRMLRLKAPYMEGDDVKALQQALVKIGMEVSIDGVFGPKTEAAVKEAQSRESLSADGIVGPATRAVLGL